MTDSIQKQGMSKGLKIGLIVGGAFIVLIAVLVGSCYVYMDDIVKMGALTFVDKVKLTVASNPGEGVDTVQVNAITDAFKKRLNAEKELNVETLGTFIQSLQYLVDKKTIDAAETEAFVNALIEYYPELGDLIPTSPVDPAPSADSAMLGDSVAVGIDAAGTDESTSEGTE